MQQVVMGYDPSMTNWGLAVANLDIEDLEFEVTHIDVIKNKLDKSKKKQVRKSSQNFDRAKYLHKQVMASIDEHKPKALFVEMPHGSQNASSQLSYAMCITVLAAVSNETGLPVFQLSEAENKKAMGLKGAITKQTMIDAVREVHPNAPWKKHKKNGEMVFTEGFNEHAADAIAAIQAGLETEEFNYFRNALKMAIGA